MYDELTPKIRARIKTKGVSFSSYCDRPIDFAHEVLGIKYLTPDIKTVLESVVKNKVTNVQSAHGQGKSHSLGILTLYWVYAVEGLCITTAPTERQVKQILWSEIRRSHGLHRRKLGGRIGELFLTVSEDSRAFGFTARSTDSNGFQGIHADKLLLIEDEACGITPEIDEGAESCIVGINNRIIRVGNPIADGTPFSKACKKSNIKIPAWNHSNVNWAYRKDCEGIHRVKEELRPYLFDENGEILDRNQWGKPAIVTMEASLKEQNAIEIKGAISVEWIETARKKYQEGSAFWESRIEARFPLDAAQSVIPRRYFYLGRIRYEQELEILESKGLSLDQSIAHIPPRYGLDVGDGGDPHAISRWRSHILFYVKPYPTLGDELDTKRAANFVIKEIDKHGVGSVGVDNVGVGAGSLAILKTEGFLASGIRWGDSANDPRFANLKAKQFWEVREGLENGQLAIAPLGEFEEELQEDWANIFYEETVKGQIKIEDKKKTIARLGRSPNCGDAAIYGYHANCAINPLLL